MRPNILLIMTDQHRGDCLGCDGHPVLETPNLDALAAEGTRFRRAYSAVPSCIPARATLLTGMNAWHTGILGMGRKQSPMPSTFEHTLPGELAAAGYHTQGIGKMHFHPQRSLNGFHHTVLDESGREERPGAISDYRRWFEQHKPGAMGYRDHGVDWNSWMARPSHLPEHLHPTWWTAQQALDWLPHRDPNKPFFLKLSFARPHSPYDPPQVYYDMYRDRPMPPPHVGDWATVHDRRIDDVNAWRSRRSEAEIQRARACYYGSITFIDHQIGRVLSELKRTDHQAWSNTLIVFLSDHGDMLGDHHLWRKTYGYEGSARVPMIVSLPSRWAAPRGQVLDQVIELQDVMPTLLDAAGVTIPDSVDGQSMLPLLRGEPTSWREFLHGQHVQCYSHEQANHYLTDGREKYIWLPYLGQQQLFNLVDDPGECRDLSQDPAWRDRVTLWRQRLAAILAERDGGLVRDGDLVKLPMDAAETSPHYHTYACRPATQA